MRIYFDYAATTPVDLIVEKAMRPYFGKVFGNPGSVHRFGQEASASVFEARQKVAKAIGAKYDEIIFTGSATEANNLALRGILDMSYRTYRSYKSYVQPRLIVSAIEHESILETVRDLENRGLAEVIYIPVSKEGIVSVKKIKEALNERTVLVSVMYANNEIGTIQPIFEIGILINNFKNQKRQSRHASENRLAGRAGMVSRVSEKSEAESERNFHAGKIDSVFSEACLDCHWPLFHTDAVQALQFLDCNVDELGVDLMTLSAHKIYGPKGVGTLYVRNQESIIKNKSTNFQIPNSKFLIPVTTGGGQEFGFRSGTENVPYIVGFGAAIEMAKSLKAKEFKRLSRLRDYFWKNLKKIFPKTQLNGSEKSRLPNNLNIYLPGSSAHDRCIELDLLGIAVSPGVACSARSSKPSYVIEALGLGGDRASSSLRFSFGRYTIKEEIDRALKVISRLTH